MTPLVSVILTTKNEARNINRCLDSVRGQTFQDFEILVIDNFSTDDTLDLARKYTDRVFSLGPERSAQRNAGFQHARGKYVIYLDADMELTSTVLSECLDACQKNVTLVGLYIPERIAGNGFWIRVRDFERSFYDGTTIDAARFMVREIVLGFGGFDATLCGPEDWDLDKQLRARGHVATIRAPLYHHEGDFALGRYLKKKTYYSGSFAAYIAKWGADDPDVRRQLGAWYRFIGVYIEKGRWRRLLSRPDLAVGMYVLRFMVALAYMKVKWQQKRRPVGALT